jgi:hypothetical protein
MKDKCASVGIPLATGSEKTGYGETDNVPHVGHQRARASRSSTIVDMLPIAHNDVITLA